MLVLCVLLPFYCVPYTINFSCSLAHSLSLSLHLSLILLVTLAAFDKRNFIWNSSKRICDFFNEAKQQLLQQIYKLTRNVRGWQLWLEDTLRQRWMGTECFISFRFFLHISAATFTFAWGPPLPHPSSSNNFRWQVTVFRGSRVVSALVPVPVPVSVCSRLCE